MPWQWLSFFSARALQSVSYRITPLKFSWLQHSGFHLNPSCPSANLPTIWSCKLKYFNILPGKDISLPHWIISGLGYCYMGITSKTGGGGEAKLPDCPSNSPFRFPKEKTGLYLPCASLSFPPLCDRLIPLEEPGWGGGSSPCPGESRACWPRCPGGPHRGCPGSRSERGSSREDFPCPNTPSGGDTSFLQTQPPFRAVLEEGWVGEAMHSATPSLFWGVRTPCLQLGVPGP